MVNNKEKQMTQPILKGIPITADDWLLYSNTDGADQVAMLLAQTLSDAIRVALTPEIAFDAAAKVDARVAVIRKVRVVINANGDFGACDGETEDVLFQLVNRAFNWTV
jgi:hypothetical protein